MSKIRLDQLLLAQGLAESRSKAQALIMAGLVYRGEQKLDKAGLEIPEETEITVRGREHPWVSRGGMKLAHALEHFNIKVAGAIAIDVGASTGGFTDVLLQNGASKVYAVDVGHGQLDVKLRNDPRVVVMEETNARNLTAEMFSPHPNPLPEGEVGEQRETGEGVFDIIVCDASFISLKKVLPAALELAKPGATLISLIKPQFEVGKAEVSRGKGVIRDSALHTAVCDDITEWITGLHWQVKGITESPITGPKGNKEFLMVAVLNVS
jgi:23S rRNA (cytidine1920-2'-O)/16S rRNA (cytidine1409-2'-O)-methyltransferase